MRSAHQYYCVTNKKGALSAPYILTLPIIKRSIFLKSPLVKGGLRISLDTTKNEENQEKVRGFLGDGAITILGQAVNCPQEMLNTSASKPYKGDPNTPTGGRLWETGAPCWRGSWRKGRLNGKRLRFRKLKKRDLHGCRLTSGLIERSNC